MKLIPASSARCTMRTQSARSRLPIAPNIIAPRHRRLTRRPERPRVSYCMGGVLRSGPVGPRRRGPQARLADRSVARGEREPGAPGLEGVVLGLLDGSGPLAPVDLALVAS